MSDALDEPLDEPADWLPPLLTMADHDNTWVLFNEAAYARFCLDFVVNQPLFRKRRVACRRDPMTDGKEFGYWHCTSEDKGGKCEAEREPDIRRLERVGWVRAVIEHAEVDSRIQVWCNDFRGPLRHSLWFDEEYLVIIEWRKAGYWQLVTAYPTVHSHSKRKLRAEMAKSPPEDSQNG